MNFDWNNPYPIIRAPIFSRNVVSTSHPLAAHADNVSCWKAAMPLMPPSRRRNIDGGEPVSNGLGSDAFAMVWDGKKLYGLNASGGAPAYWNLAYFRQKYGEDGQGFAKRPERGWDAIAVPGAIAGWTALHARFGKLPIEHIAPIVARKWQAALPILAGQSGFSGTFMRAPNIGEK